MWWNADMSGSLCRPTSLEAHLEWEERQEDRWEFDGFAPVAMTLGMLEHSAIQLNPYRALGNRLSGSPCRVFTSDLKIRAAGSIRYPDAFAVCSPQRRGTTVVEDPVMVFEILSPGTMGTDRVVKNREYRDTPSIHRYVMLEQD
jgi:Uma2 family endonuclease